MSDMVERVARALCAGTGSSRLVVEVSWRHFEHHARAAILAMREPTEGMFIAGVVCMAAFHDHPDMDMSFPKLWGHVIDEALK